MNVDEEQIRRVIDTWHRATSAGDVDSVMRTGSRVFGASVDVAMGVLVWDVMMTSPFHRR